MHHAPWLDCESFRGEKMMISFGLSVLLALTGSVQIRDGVTRAQEGYTSCLSRFAETSRTARKSADDFNSALAQQCAEQERAFREAMIRRDTASRMSRADAEQAANEEIEYARENVREMYAASVTPR
jgi:hypothetical protein